METTNPATLPVESRIIEVRTYGGGAKYGKNLVKVAMHDGYLLERQGWEMVHRGSDYAYIRHPSGEKAKPTLALDIPALDALECFALACHAAGVPCGGELPGGWLYKYEPSHDRTSKFKTSSQRLVDGELQVVRSEREETHHVPADFKILGIAFAHPQLPPGRTMILQTPWSYHARWHDGDDAPPRAGESII